MLLVFLFVIIVIIILIFFSNLKITVDYIKISNLNEEEKINIDYFVKTGLYMGEKFKIFEFSFKNGKKHKFLNKLKGKFSKNKLSNYAKKQVIKTLLKLNYKIDKFYLNLRYRK